MGRFWISMVITTTALLAGCGVTAQERLAVSRFARATEKLSGAVGEALVGLRERTIADTRGVLDAGNPRGAALWLDDLDRALDAEDVAARLLALRALAMYASLLEALAADDDADAIASDLATTLGLIGVSEPGVLAAGALLDHLRSISDSSRRGGAMRAVIGASDPVVEALSRLIEHDLDPAGLGFASQALIARSDAVAAGVGEMTDDPSLVALVEAVRSMRTAHHAMSASADRGGSLSLDAIEEFVLKTQEAVALATVVAGG